MEIKFIKQASKPSLLFSILILCLGAILFKKAEEVLEIVSIGLGIIIAVIGIISILMYGKDARQGNDSKANLTIGILLIIIATIFILCHDVVEGFIRYIIAGYILLTGVMRLLNAFQVGITNKKGISLLLVSLILIGLAIFMAIKDNFILETAGLMMIIYAVLEIISFILYDRGTESLNVIQIDDNTVLSIENKTEVEEEVEEESPKKKKKKVKEAKAEQKKTKKNKEDK